MNPIFKPETVKTFVGVLLLLFLIKLLWFAVEMVWFPAEGVTHAEKRSVKPLYYRVKLTQNEAPPPVQKKPKAKPSVGTIKDITLLAIYGSSDIAVVTVKYKNTTKVLGKGESINGFVLESVGSNDAVFSKNGKRYRVSLFIQKSKKGKGVIQPVSISHTQIIPDTNRDNTAEGEIVDAGDHKIIEKSLLKHYTKNIDDLYKNIGIQEVKKNGAIEGFRVTFIRRGTPFAKLGVKRGDVIKAINGQELTSYSAALNVYKDIDKAQNITLLIERKNQEMELEYEIN
jgi:general secretion pathway protein C